MASKSLRSLLGGTVEYDGRQYTVEHVRTTWRRVMPPIDEVALRLEVHLAASPEPSFPILWVNVVDITPNVSTHKDRLAVPMASLQERDELFHSPIGAQLTTQETLL